MGIPTNVRNEVNSNSHYFTTFPGGGGGKYENKANSVSFQLKFHVWTELGNILYSLVNSNRKKGQTVGADRIISWLLTLMVVAPCSIILSEYSKWNVSKPEKHILFFQIFKYVRIFMHTASYATCTMHAGFIDNDNLYNSRIIFFKLTPSFQFK